MIAHVIYKQSNPDYDKEYAKEYHGGKESENNQKLQWHVALSSSVSDFTGHTIRRNEALETRGGQIKGMTLIEGLSASKGIILLGAVSDTLVKKIHVPVNNQYQIIRIYIYLHETAEFVHDGAFYFEQSQLK